MFKLLKYLGCFLLLCAFLLACKPVRKSYLPYKKRNKCGCPTYGFHQKDKHQAAFWANSAEKEKLFQ
jgi:hypothetical protein